MQIIAKTGCILFSALVLNAYAAMPNSDICTNAKGVIVEKCLEYLDDFDKASNIFERQILFDRAISAFKVATGVDFTPDQRGALNEKAYCNNTNGSKELMSFAIANANKFPSEAKTRPGVLTFYTPAGLDDLSGVTYDDVDGVMRGLRLPLINNIWVENKCSPKGSYVGVTARGLKIKVIREDCNRLVALDQSLNFSESIDIPMNPEMYRKAKSGGFLYKIAFSVGEGVNQELTTTESVRFSPTLNSPTDQNATIRTVYGKIRKICIFSRPGIHQLIEISP